MRCSAIMLYGKLQGTSILFLIQVCKRTRLSQFLSLPSWSIQASTIYNRLISLQIGNNQKTFDSNIQIIKCLFPLLLLQMQNSLEPIEPTASQSELANQQSSSSSSEADFDPNDPNQKFFNLSDIKPLDFKSKWLGNTNEVITKFQKKLSQLQLEKGMIKQQLLKFAENQQRFKISSMRKININLDKKQLYQEFIKKTRKIIEKLHPSIIINICSYVSQNTFLALARLRRVSTIFNFIYTLESVVDYFSQKDFGKQGYPLSLQQKWCERYIDFKQTFFYYKQIKYTLLIPQNSIKQDIQNAVNFINEVYKHFYALKSSDFDYFYLVNSFMKQHRVVMALQALTFSDMAITKKASIVAFSNYLAFNPSARQKQEITKTKYLKMIQLVQDEHYRDSLVINSKISNFLMEQYNYTFSVFIDTLRGNQKMRNPNELTFDVVIYHYHNEQKSTFMKGVLIGQQPIQYGELSVEFVVPSMECRIFYTSGNKLQSQFLHLQYLPTVEQNNKFGQCYIFRGEVYYIILIKLALEQSNQV